MMKVSDQFLSLSRFKHHHLLEILRQAQDDRLFGCGSAAIEPSRLNKSGVFRVGIGRPRVREWAAKRWAVFRVEVFVAAWRRGVFWKDK
jgi:hypothetical protein